MKLGEYVDLLVLEDMIDQRYVSEQKHPVEPLSILNYTQRAQFDRVWNDVTRKCRGLIYNHETGLIVARPWPKFFNWGEDYDDPGRHGPDAPVIVTDKIDGSLGILYYAPESREWAIATRGSFTSDQALHATDILWERYDGWLVGADTHPVEGVTYLFEIVYPDNRVVVDYGDLDDLVFLGAVENETGLPASPRLYHGPRAKEFQYRTLADALAAEPRENCEGLVVTFLDGPCAGERVKLKQEDYVRLHRIVTGLNERTVWEHLGTGAPLEDLLAPLPEEFHEWVCDVADGLALRAEHVYRAAAVEYEMLRTQDLDRKSFAALANESEYRPYLFMLLDRKDPRPAIWKTLRPVRPKTLVHADEAVA